MFSIILIFAAVFAASFSVAFFAFVILHVLSQSTSKKADSILNNYEKN